MSEQQVPLLVLDTSVAIKFYIPEEGHEEAVVLLEAAEAGTVELLAPGTLLPEGYNALVQQQRRGLLDEDDVREAWEKLLVTPIYTYAVEDLIEHAVEISRETGVIVYDALFLALAEVAGAVLVTADERSILKRIRGTNYGSLAAHLMGIPSTLGENAGDHPRQSS